MFPPTRVLAILVLAHLGGCCSLSSMNLKWSAVEEYRVLREKPFLPLGTNFYFMTESVRAGVASESEQDILFEALKGGLTDLARKEGLRPLSNNTAVAQYLATLPERDLRSADNLAEVGRLANASKVVSFKLTTWSAVEGDIKEQKSSVFKKVTRTRTDRRSYSGSVRVFDYATGLLETIELPLETDEDDYEGTNGNPPAFDKSRELAKMVPVVVSKVVKKLSPYEKKSLLLYPAYELDFALNPGFDNICVRKNLKVGIEAARKGYWGAALAAFEEEWKLIEKDEDKVAQARVQWNMAIAYRYLQRYPEALIAARECDQCEDSQARRDLINELIPLALEHPSGPVPTANSAE